MKEKELIAKQKELNYYRGEFVSMCLKVILRHGSKIDLTKEESAVIKQYKTDIPIIESEIADLESSLEQEPTQMPTDEDKNHIEWIYDMINIHKENLHYDYMIKFKNILSRLSVPEVREEYDKGFKDGFDIAMSGKTPTDEALQTYFANVIIHNGRMTRDMNESEAIAMVKHFLKLE